MKREDGITLITLVATIMIMGVLAALLVKASVGGNLLKKVYDIEEDYNNEIKDVEEKTESINQKWNGII